MAAGEKQAARPPRGSNASAQRRGHGRRHAGEADASGRGAEALPPGRSPFDRFRVGVNYWPARAAMRFWRRFDPAVVDDDFARIANARLDSVRVFLWCEHLRPLPDRASIRGRSTASWIDLDPKRYFDRPAEHRVRLYRRFRERYAPAS